MGILDDLETEGTDVVEAPAPDPPKQKTQPKVKKDKGNPDENLVIQVNRPSLVTLPEATVNGKRYTEIFMIPGENDVPRAQWEAARKNPAIKIWVGCKLLENKGPGKAKSFSEGLDALSRMEAQERIVKCDTVKILRDWADQTESPALKALCNERINEIIAVGKGD